MSDAMFVLTMMCAGWLPWSVWKLCAKDDQIRDLRHQLADSRYEKDSLELHLKKAIDRIEELEKR